jgi:hypothetical protein
MSMAHLEGLLDASFEMPFRQAQQLLRISGERFSMIQHPTRFHPPRLCQHIHPGKRADGGGIIFSVFAEQQADYAGYCPIRQRAIYQCQRVANLYPALLDHPVIPAAAAGFDHLGDDGAFAGAGGLFVAGLAALGNFNQRSAEAVAISDTGGVFG